MSKEFEAWWDGQGALDESLTLAECKAECSNAYAAGRKQGVLDADAKAKVLLDALEDISRNGYGLQGIEEDYGNDSNAFNYHAYMYFSERYFNFQSKARRAIAAYRGEK